MNFVNVRIGAVWASLSVLLSSEMALIDSQLKKAINGDDGSTHAPSTQIVIGGAGASFTGDLFASSVKQLDIVTGGTGFSIGANAVGTIKNLGTLTVASGGLIQVLASGNFAVNNNGTATLQSGSILNVVAGAVLNIHASATIDTGSTWTFAGAGAGIRIGDGVAVGLMTVTTGSSLAINAGGTLTINGTIAGASTRTGSLVLSGAGATTAYRHANGADADGTYDTSQDVLVVPTLVTIDRVWTFKSTSPTPPVGARIRVSSWGTQLHQLELRREDASVICRFPGATGFPMWADLEFAAFPTDGGVPRWHACAWSRDVTLIS